MSHKSATIRRTLKSLNWPLLRKQKETVLHLARSDIKLANHMYDIAHLLDALQDAAVADGLATEDEVFGQFNAQ